MPHGFFTVEQWKAAKPRAKPQWVPVLHLDARQSVTMAIEAIQTRGKPGLFRVIQTQRQIWADKDGGKLRLGRSHASSHEELETLTELFEREGGRRPVEKARLERAAAKAKRAGR